MKTIRCLLAWWAVISLCTATLLPGRANAQAKVADKPPASGPLEVVAIGKPTRKTLTLTTTQPARTEPAEQAPIFSKLSAYVAEVYVDYGDQVKQGAPLAKLRAPEIDADVAQKQALLAQAKAESIQADALKTAAIAAVGTAKAKVTQAQAGLARAEAELARWQSEYTRVKTLAASGAVNRQLAEEAEQKYAAAQALSAETKAAVEAAKAAVVQAESEAISANAGIATATSKIQVAEANVRQAEALQSYLTLTAPFEGVIIERRIDPGHFAQPAANSGPVLKIARQDKVRVFVSVPEAEAGYVDLGDPVLIDIPTVRGLTFTGKVTRTSYAIDPMRRALETIVDLDGPLGRLRPGMFATATITLQEQKDALTLPATAVVRQGKDTFCFRYRDGKAVKTMLRPGLKVGDELEVIEGLTADEVVILNKVAQLSDGQSVNIAAAVGK